MTVRVFTLEVEFGELLFEERQSTFRDTASRIAAESLKRWWSEQQCDVQGHEWEEPLPPGCSFKQFCGRCHFAEVAV